MKRTDLLSKSKLYKMRLEGREQLSIFDEWVGSDNRELFIRAMDNDLHKIAPLRFEHPKNKEKVYYHHYMLCPANGNTLMVVGQFRDPMDFAYVIIVLNSKKYEESYMVIEKYSRLFRNPDMLAEMVANAYNEVLREVGVRVVFEPWDTKGKVVTYLQDGWESYNIELFNSQGRNLIRMGYEDALEVNKVREARKTRRQTTKKTRIKDYILIKDHQQTLKILRDNIKDKRTPKKIALPFRLLCDRGITERIPYKTVIKDMPELEGRISETAYNHWTYKMASDYDKDSDYERLNKDIDRLIKVASA